MELDEMRSQFGELKSMLKDQQIVNEKMARRAMKGDYNKVRKDLIFAIVLEVVAIPLQVVLLPLIGMPTWYLVFTVLFLLSALVASVYSLRRYASADMISGNLTEVALGIVKYKRFELNGSSMPSRCCSCGYSSSSIISQGAMSQSWCAVRYGAA